MAIFDGALHFCFVWPTTITVVPFSWNTFCNILQPQLFFDFTAFTVFVKPYWKIITKKKSETYAVIIRSCPTEQNKNTPTILSYTSLFYLFGMALIYYFFFCGWLLSNFVVTFCDIRGITWIKMLKAICSRIKVWISQNITNIPPIYVRWMAAHSISIPGFNTSMFQFSEYHLLWFCMSYRRKVLRKRFLLRSSNSIGCIWWEGSFDIIFFTFWMISHIMMMMMMIMFR